MDRMMKISKELEQKVNDTRKLLHYIASTHTPVVFANSLGAEDMVLTDLIFESSADIEIFTLDTGRLPEETYALIQQITEKYGQSPKVYFPDQQRVETFTRQQGINAFYQSVELRKECCYIRKVEPLKRALKDKQAWITGLRREQAVTRADLPVEEWDADNGLKKFNPLADWNQDEVWEYLHALQIPYNALHDQNFPSIGCGPCTRAITPGEDVRAGRWWWEDPTSKECGLHIKKIG
ncbi:MAG: phosphoadenylyl-sulfate reductase [Gammaproteobacteria bacterium]|nr:phosphoadenylyl-sulfate reductase [Gammaproteobacteria bacterium]